MEAFVRVSVPLWLLRIFIYELTQSRRVNKIIRQTHRRETGNFEVNDGEIVGLLGQNGAGKSTSFNMIIGAIRPDSGRVIFQNEDITNLPHLSAGTEGDGVPVPGNFCLPASDGGTEYPRHP